jgi:hypothetical protein
MRDIRKSPALETDEIDYSGRPFDYHYAGTSTAMICDHSPEVREKIRDAMLSLDFNVIEPATVQEAIKYIVFHNFNVIIVNENFDREHDGCNYLIEYLNSLPIPVRRKIYIILISSTFATMDYMNTLNKSVNLIIHEEDIAEAGLIIKQEMTENDYFYHIFLRIQEEEGKL